MSFKILVVADFSGSAREGGRIGSVVPVDLDNFDEVMSALAPAVEIEGKRFIFRSLQEFHPDQLYSSVAAGSVRKPASPPATVPKAPPSQRRGSSVSLLDDILDADESAHAPVTVDDAADLNAFLRRVTIGEVAEPEDTQKAQRDQAAGESMRAVLHDPAFQSLESAWRSLHFLLRGADQTSRVYLLDATLPELVRYADQLDEPLKKRGPWNLIVADFYFGQSETDAAVLGRLGAFAKELGATLLAGGIVPEDAGSEGWQDLRRSSLATRIGLVLPRFLLRLPYGRETSSVDRFAFEEMPQVEHSRYLWGNGAFAAAFLIGGAYDEDDPNWRRRIQRRIDGIPLHVYREGAEHLSTPTAEVLMSEQHADALLDAGLMPLASLKDQDGVVLVQFRSIAEPPAPLAVLM